jgi:DNA (cytosine-5)-methyltransferase 1
VTQPLTFGSLFAGIGGIDLGLERAGMVCKWQVESDDYATRVLKKHWPNVQRFRDVRDCGVHNLPRVDLICGGFPCQDVSFAGKRQGLAGERTTLWSEFARIIRELEPRWVLAENVPGLLSADDGRFFGQALRDLAACGYDAEWDCIPAAAIGAPHRRDRIFIVAYPAGMFGSPVLRVQPQRVLSSDVANPDGGGQQIGQELDGTAQERPPDRGAQGQYADRCSDHVAHAYQPRCDQRPGARNDYRGRRQSANGGQKMADPNQQRRMAPKTALLAGGAAAELCGWWATEPDVGRVADGVPFRVDRLRCLGNAVVPQVAELVGRMIVAADARGENDG